MCRNELPHVVALYPVTVLLFDPLTHHENLQSNVAAFHELEKFCKWSRESWQ